MHPSLLTLAVWAGLWAAGGYGLARRAFALRPNEQVLAGLALGLAVETWLANLLAQLLPPELAFWLAAGAVLVAGLAAAWQERGTVPPAGGQKLPLPRPADLIPLALALGLTALFTAQGRGLAIFDDYQNLPTTSLIAAGGLPLHFALDPAVRFGYHHFTLLFAAQIMRSGGLDPWLSLDLARGLAMALSMLLLGAWVRRLMASRLAGAVAACVYTFGMGTRWLLLLLPSSTLQALSAHITLMGSGLSSGPTLAQAMFNAWQIEGSGPVPFPFAFTNGIFQAPVLNLNGTGQMLPVIGFLLLLTATRWQGRGRLGWALSVILLACTGLLGESGVVLGAAAWGLLAAWQILRRRNLRLPGRLWAWLAAVGLSGMLILLQGGVLTELLFSKLASATGSEDSYFSFNFSLVFPPAAISAHLGPLSAADPAQLLVGLLEIGPVLLVLPLLVVWGVKAARSASWYLAATVLTGVLGLGMFFIQYSGTAGLSATTRLQALAIQACQVFAVPLVWIWLRRRSRLLKAAAIFLALLMVTGGLVEAGVSLAGISKPIPTTFITSLDVRAYNEYWNQLEKSALVFDPVPSRAPTLFGRETNSNSSWYQTKPEWEALAAAPDAGALRAYGFSYAYYDRRYFSALLPAAQAGLQAGCTKLVKEYTNQDGDFRRLVDLRGCQ